MHAQCCRARAPPAERALLLFYLAILSLLLLPRLLTFLQVLREDIKQNRLKEII